VGGCGRNVFPTGIVYMYTDRFQRIVMLKRNIGSPQCLVLLAVTPSHIGGTTPEHARAHPQQASGSHTDMAAVVLPK
jgi:hypothetical protein